jgi:hypothetical protein
MTLAFDYMILADNLERSAQQAERLAYIDHEAPISRGNDPTKFLYLLADACRRRAIQINPACADPTPATHNHNQEGSNT